MAPLLFLIMSKHSSALCQNGTEQPNHEEFISQHADLILRGLSIEN
jgi:TetR/AcrR family transcriptional regulator